MTRSPRQPMGPITKALCNAYSVFMADCRAHGADLDDLCDPWRTWAESLGAMASAAAEAGI